MKWSEPWGRLGLWLTLWDEGSERLQQSALRQPFWEALARHSNMHRETLERVARQAMLGELIVAELARRGSAVVIAVPMMYRGRALACVLACGLTPDFFDDENIAHFCSVNGLDRVIFEQLARDVPAHGSDTLRSFAEILNHQVDTFSEGILSQRDIDDLSAHLGEAYEELNLIYRIGTHMNVSRSPAEHFEDVLAELLEVTVVDGFVAALDWPSRQESEPILVVSGNVPAGRDDLLRLYRQIRGMDRNAGSYLVLNNIADQPELAWASSWLRRVVLFELATKQRVFGGILAINHRKQKDFGSQETQLINAVVDRSSAFLENVLLYEDLEQLFMGMLHSLVSSIDAKDPYTCGHSQRVAWLSRHIARLAGVSEEESQRFYMSGLLHDIGKIGVSEPVLCKDGRLTEEEFAEMRRHPEIGARILEGVRHVDDLMPGILYHHERYDGRGYPQHLAADDIPLMGRILCIADSFDAMTTDRTYRSARPLPIALSEIRRFAGTQFDPHLCELFLKENVGSLKRHMMHLARSPLCTGDAGLQSVGTGGVE